MYHLLCYFVGDGDATVSMIEKRALGVDGTLGEDNHVSMKSDSSSLVEEMANMLM